jgi:hypothetical protein
MCNRLLPRASALINACEDEDEDQCGHCGSSYLSQGGAVRARLEASLSNWPNFILAPHLDAFLKQRAEQHQQVAAERLGMQGQFAEEGGGAYDEEDEEEGDAMEYDEGGPAASNDVEGDEDEFDEQNEQ